MGCLPAFSWSTGAGLGQNVARDHPDLIGQPKVAFVIAARDDHVAVRERQGAREIERRSEGEIEQPATLRDGIVDLRTIRTTGDQDGCPSGSNCQPPSRADGCPPNMRFRPSLVEPEKGPGTASDAETESCKTSSINTRTVCPAFAHTTT